ncbi:MAG: metallophosphoesterase [Candidatus Aenigmarchaeota archaeon]|nr:metallophosphoesterase [Candidatus Aenigmarchaeota archaeon]
MRIAVIGDIHGKIGKLQKIINDLENKDYDIIVSQGDFTDMFDITVDFTQLEIADVVIQKLMIPKKPVLCVPGNHDPFEILDIFEEYGVNAHHKVSVFGGITFVGWGGAETPFNTLFEPTDDDTKEALDVLLKDIKKPWIFITHAPPKGTSLDKLEKKHVGSAEIAKVIEKKTPILNISAHIHENRGVDMIGKTTIFYPGPAYSGYYGIVTVEGSNVYCETLKAV